MIPLRWLQQALYLTSSGIAAAAGFALLAAGGTFSVNQEATNTFLLLVAAHTLGITAGVFGSDKQVLSWATPSASPPRISRGLRHWNLLIAATAAIYFHTRFDLPPAVATLLAIAIPADAYCIIMQTWLSTRQRAHTVLIANLLRYPLFFVLLLATDHGDSIPPAMLAALYALTAAARLGYILAKTRHTRPTTEPRLGLVTNVGLFQVANYILFRGGQLIAGLPYLGTDEARLAGILLCWKIIELIDKALLHLLPVIRRMQTELPQHRMRQALAGIVLVAAASFATLTHLAGGIDLDYWILLPLLLNAALVLPANLSVLARYQHAGFRDVLRAGVLALAACTVASLPMIVSGHALFALVSWTPLGLLIFILLLRR